MHPSHELGELLELIDTLEFDDDDNLELASILSVPPPPPEEWPQRNNPFDLSQYSTPQPAPSSPTKLRHAIAWGANCMVFLVFVAMILGAVMFRISGDSGRSLFGYRVFLVTSASDDFRANDLMIARLADARRVEPGDVVTLRREGQPPLTQSVTEILYPFDDDTGLGFVTQGDTPIGGSQLIGVKVFTIPRLGHVLAFAENHFVLTIMICVVVLSGSFVLFVLLLRTKKPPVSQNKLHKKAPA